jgi:hypothetical protein
MLRGAWTRAEPEIGTKRSLIAILTSIMILPALLPLLASAPASLALIVFASWLILAAFLPPVRLGPGPLALLSFSPALHLLLPILGYSLLRLPLLLLTRCASRLRRGLRGG